MPFGDLQDFLTRVIREAREPALRYVAKKLAGDYGANDPHARCWAAQASEANRSLLAETLVWTVDDALAHLFVFIEENIERGISLNVPSGSATYAVDGTDMLQAWFGEAVDRLGQITGESLKRMVEEPGGPQ